MPTLSYQRIKAGAPLSDEELLAKIKRTTANNHDFQVLEAFITFNKHVSCDMSGFVDGLVADMGVADPQMQLLPSHEGEADSRLSLLTTEN